MLSLADQPCERICHLLALTESLLHFIKQLVRHKILMMVRGHSPVGCMFFKDSIRRSDLLHDYIFWLLKSQIGGIKTKANVLRCVNGIAKGL